MIRSQASQLEGRGSALLFAGAAAGLLTFLPLGAAKAQPSSGYGQNAMARCATYGEGFVPVEGGRGCVKIGGRLRVETEVSPPSALLPGAAVGFGESCDGLRPASHVRVPGR